MGARSSVLGYDHDPSDCQSDWMFELMDNSSIADVSIPGTNGSASWPGYGALYLKCQVWPLEKQLRNGNIQIHNFIIILLVDWFYDNDTIFPGSIISLFKIKKDSC